MSLSSAVTRSQSQSHTHTRRAQHPPRDPQAHCITLLPAFEHFIWSPCDVSHLPFVPNIFLGWQPVPHTCTHPLSVRQARQHLINPRLGPEQGWCGGGRTSQEDFFPNSHTHPPSGHYLGGSMAQWPRGRLGAGHLGSNPGVVTCWLSVSRKGNLSVPRFPPPIN